MSSISGTNLAAAIAPFTTEDTYPTHYAEYGKGGWHSVATIAARDAIPSQRRETGMVVFVQADNTPYRLEADGTWKKMMNDIDSALSEISENPVQNRVITDAIKNIRDTVITDVVYHTGDSVIEPNKFNVWLEPITSELTITKGTDIENILNHYYIRFTVGEGFSLALADFGTITWHSFVPTWTVGKTYEISIIGNLVLWAEF